MNESECSIVVKIKAGDFAELIRKNGNAEASNPLNDLNFCMRKDFIYWAVVMYKNRFQDLSFIEFTADLAFTEAILKYKEEALSGKITNLGATVKTLLFTFFKIKLMELILYEQRRLDKEKKYIKIAEKNGAAEGENMEMKEFSYNLLKKALSAMEEKDREIIVRRHLKEEKPAAIAAQMQISVLAVNNKLYRSMKRLKIEIDKLKNNGTN